MLLQKPRFFHFVTRQFSTTKLSPRKSIQDWRTKLKQTQIVSQVSTIILQRHTNRWSKLLHPLKLSSSFTPTLFLQILNKTKNNPQLSLNFLIWAKTHLGYQPDLRVQCALTRILFGSGLSGPANSILDAVVEAYPSSQIVSVLYKGDDFRVESVVLSSVLECYCRKGLYLEALNVYFMAKNVVLTDGCNELLNVLYQKNEVNLALCVYGSMIRNGVLENESTWSVLSRILCKDGKLEKIVKILDLGICNSDMYDSVIEGYSKRGNFDAAFHYLNEMGERKINASFSTYSAILDGACRFGDDEMIEKVKHLMVEKSYLAENAFPESDFVIQRFSDLGRPYASELYFKRACDENIKLGDATYGCMLRALSQEGRLENAIGIYRIILERKIVVDDSCQAAFVDILCKENPTQEINKLLKDVIGKGFFPSSAELSKYIKAQCNERRWKDAEDLLGLVLDKGVVLDSFPVCSLVKHYCSTRRFHSALALHAKLEILGGTLDVMTYNLLLSALFRERRIEEAIRIFDYMRSRNYLLSSESYMVMIRGLCNEKELRRAMKLHDEMLRLGLKPDGKTYKRIITGFK